METSRNRSPARPAWLLAAVVLLRDRDREPEIFTYQVLERAGRWHFGVVPGSCADLADGDRGAARRGGPSHRGVAAWMLRERIDGRL